MPGYIIHLAAAKELQPRLEKLQILKTDRHINEFLVSCLIPDATENKASTHYYHTDDSAIQIRYPQPWRFCQAYPELVSSPAGMGYLFHLYVDYLFYHEFFPRHIQLTDSNHVPQVRKEKIDLVLLPDFNRILDGKTFFQKGWLYNDYTLINGELEKRYQLTYEFSPVENPGFSQADYSRMDQIQKEILQYSEMSHQSDTGKTQVLKMEPLLEFIRTAAPRFCNDYPFWISYQ